MPVPTSVADLSTTAASNSPAGADAIGTSLDDYLRTIQAIIKQQDSKGADIASSATIDIPNAGAYFVVTGTTTINAISDDWVGRKCVLKFSGALQLTHSSGLILPGSANITTAAGDCLVVVNESSGVWRVVVYQRADGTSIGASGDFKADGSVPMTGDLQIGAGKGIIFEGTTADAFETTLTAGEPTADRAIALPNKSGTLATTDDIASSTRIQPISASVAGNALTISAPSLSLDFRSTTLGSGTVTTVSGDPADLVISSGSTLGTVNATQSRIAVLALNNAGTIELAAVNIAGGNNLDETTLISTTAEGGAGAADSASVIYSATARTSVAFRVIGYIESTQATAGTWATAPSTIQGAGGNALGALQSLGYSQTWQSFTGSRSVGTTYYNTTGRPISVFVTALNSAGYVPSFAVAGTTITSATMAGITKTTFSFIVPPGASYVMTASGTGSIDSWLELR